ncbi:MAG: hypothetical protein LQ351_002111 [Letrouitia transgressa]|nr:MAG: hypothetical protein LQ351_002111 [Letrouitia transgressa]
MTVSKHIESVAVIGAGISGVVSAKQLKLAGIKVVVYERTGTVGGIWCYDERPSPEPKYPSTSPSVAEDYLETNEGPSSVLQSVKELLHAPPG